MTKNLELGRAKLAGKAWVAYAVIAVWVIFLAFAIWQRAQHSLQPPVYDSQSYLLKAINFWQTAGRGEWAAAFRVEPAVRPIGTVVLTAPFGFSADYRAYHFRSVFFPIVLVVAAVYTAVGRARWSAYPWGTASIALLFSSLPMFYHFDLTEQTAGPTHWGLVDNFQAGLAALAVGLMLSSLRRLSVARFVSVSLLGTAALLVKPSGAMVMALLISAWGFLLVHAASLTPRGERQRLARYAWHSTAAFGVVSAAAAFYCVWSGYISTENLAYAKQALVVMQRELRVSGNQLVSLFQMTAGVALPVWIIALALVSASTYRLVRPRGSEEVASWPPVACATLIWSAGVWYWMVVQAGENQIRYFYPFMLMGAMCLMPGAMNVWGRAGRRGRAVLVAVAIAPALNVAAMLASGDAPSVEWQKASGVSVTVAVDHEEVAQAHRLLDEVRAWGSGATLYSFSSGVASWVFENVGMYERLVRPDAPTFTISRPIDWVNGFGVRIEDLASAGYILVRKYPPEASQRASFLSFEEERVAFQAWLATGEADAGVQVASDGTHMRLLRVTDPTALRQALGAFVAAHRWRPEFLKANDVALALAPPANPLAEDVTFSDTYRLHWLSIRREGAIARIDAKWVELRHDPANAKRHLFLHLVDGAGKILHNQQIDLSPPPAQRGGRSGLVRFPGVDGTGVTALAFGVYHEDGTYLTPDKGPTDWGGRRILIPLKDLVKP